MWHAIRNALASESQKLSIMYFDCLQPQLGDVKALGLPNRGEEDLRRQIFTVCLLEKYWSANVMQIGSHGSCQK